ncbi:hypothetical protein MOQ72_42295 [Saccharopolyspora sp. K220]|uniref:hypothetical protein n=1 Tax=Saccharopolyspora soli TaxID=2926618 RepID=UPI001F5780A0|nr:hypothetical protein [Saccharopolyspora soli]MCI2424049.1 hypothetical protein [Saccharopolyspora soli]
MNRLGSFVRGASSLLLGLLADHIALIILLKLDYPQRTHHPHGEITSTGLVTGWVWRKLEVTADYPVAVFAWSRWCPRSARRSVSGGAFGSPDAVACTTPFAPDIVETGEAVTVIAVGRRLRFAPAAAQCVRLLLSGYSLDLVDGAATNGVDAQKLGAVLLEVGLCTQVTPALCLACTALDYPPSCCRRRSPRSDHSGHRARAT